MEKRLFEAAVKGDVNSLRRLVEEDPLILDRITLTSFNETHLHVAVMRNHLGFVEELLKLNPQLAMEVDSRKSSPLHMASVKGYVDIVEVLIRINSDMCLARDRDGRNPLHLAAIKGKLQVFKMLSQKIPSAAYKKTNREETVLHLCVKYDHFEALKILLEGIIHPPDFVNAKDVDGNTIIHLAVNDKQIETIKYLLKNTNVDLNEKNEKGETALDILSQTQRDVIDLEISDTLREAGALRGNNLPQSSNHNGSTNSKHNLNGPKAESKKIKAEDHDWLSKKRDSIMVVASLIATMAFQAGVNPTGGVWQETLTVDSNGNILQNPHQAGESVMAYHHPRSYRYFIRANTVAFVSSLSTILFLISGLPFRRKLFMWMLMVIMWLTITSIALTYAISIIRITPKDLSNQISQVINISVSVWCGVMSLLLLGNTIRLLSRWLKKTKGIDLRIWKNSGKVIRVNHGDGDSNQETLPIRYA